MSSGAYEKISQDNGDVTSGNDPKDCHNLASLIPKSESIIAETESTTVIAKSPSPKYTSHGTLVVPGWPSKPNTLTRSGLARYSGTFCDIVCIVATLPFFALATAAVKLNGHPASSNQWNVISEAMNTAVTVFPIIFGGIVARTVKITAAWRLEHGTTIGSLEQLLGSMSLLGAVQTQYSLRIFNIAGTMLIATAILSPLGGQASLRMLRMEDQPISSRPTVVHLDTESETLFEGGDYSSVLPPLNAAYTSSLMAPESIKNSSMDMWDNVRIPFLSQLNSSASSAGWKNVPAQNVLYSSLFGIPIAGLPDNANTSFTMDTSYFDLDCYNVTYGPQIFNISSESPGGLPPRFSISMDGFFNEPYGSVWGFINVTNQTFPQRTLTLQSRLVEMWNASLVQCHVSTAYVESAINCTGRACAVTSIRPSQNQHPDTRLVAFEFPGFFDIYSEQLALATGNSDPRSSSVTELYIQTPNDPFSGGYEVPAELYAVPPDQLSVRLGQVLNTYYLGSLSPLSLTDFGLPSPFYTPPNISVTAFSTTNEPFYVCLWGWWIVFVLASTTMLVAAVVGAVLHRLSIGPDILGYVSSMTRDSPYIHLPPGGSTLDGMDRARLLKGVEVRLGDVRGEYEVGRIALAFSDDGVASLAKSRQYS